ncbi:MAG: hypothetical protein EAX96_08215 [Candidatus Lokiarchaeota archaeon]|nr:hypothetical protein [Candidatus Lokiarchaeota archaeon]
MAFEYEKVAKLIYSKIGESLQTRPYIAIYDYNGNSLYQDKNLQDFSDTLSDFIKRNFKFLEVGDHSIPFSGRNLVIFRVTNKAAVVLYTIKGYVGQILSFKTILPEISFELDKIMGDIPEFVPAAPAFSIESEVPTEKKEIAKIFPNITKNVKKKDKFLIEEMAVLRFADGKNTIKEIVEKTGTNQEDVLRILESFADKKKVDFRIEGNPQMVPILIKEIPEMSVNLGIITKKELEISKACTGNRIIEEIFLELKYQNVVESLEELNKHLDSMIRKKFLRMRFLIE